MKIRRTWPLVALVFGLVAIVAVACGDGDEDAVPTLTKEDIGSAVQQAVAAAQQPAAPTLTKEDIGSAVQQAVAAAQQPAAQAGPSAEEIRALVASAVADAVPKGTSAADIQAAVEAAVNAASGDAVTAAQIEGLVSSAVESAVGETLSASDVKAIVDAAVMAIPPPETVTPAPVAFAKYGESPDLATLVRAGRLPPVGERLPRNPLVLPVADEIGQYGGTWRSAHPGAGGYFQALEGTTALIRFPANGYEAIPGIAEDWEISDDGKIFTFHLREGHKWSDGAPFTTEDVRFYWEDVIMHPDLQGDAPGWAKVGGKAPTLEILDETTFRFTYPDPFNLFIEQIQFNAYSPAFWAPAHYLKQFHPTYSDQAEVDKTAADAGFDNWPTFFNDRMDASRWWNNADRPVLTPWMPTGQGVGEGDGTVVRVRNPYYYGVDPEGNQLPYIDKVVEEAIGDNEVMNLRAMAGDFDMQYAWLSPAKIPDLMENRERGDYRILLWPEKGGSDCGFTFNQTYEGDAATAQLLKNLDFRIAMSHALDREKIQELIFQGMGELRQMVPHRSSLAYPGDEWAFKYIEFDQAKANEILDTIIPDKNAEDFRLHPDGSEVIIELITFEEPQFVDCTTLGKEMWDDVGVKIDHEIVSEAAYFARAEANDMQISIGSQAANDHPFSFPYWTMPFHWASRMAPLMGWHFMTGGEQGIPATGDLLKVTELHLQANGVSEAERAELAKEIIRTNVDNLWTIGTVGLTTGSFGIIAVGNDFLNVAESPEWFTVGDAPTFFFKR